MFTTRSPPQPQTQWLSCCHALGSAAHRICQNCQQGCPTCPMPALIWGPLGSSPSLRSCPLIVYNPSSNPLFHSHPYVAQYSIWYPAAYISAYATQSKAYICCSMTSKIPHDVTSTPAYSMVVHTASTSTTRKELSPPAKSILKAKHAIPLGVRFDNNLAVEAAVEAIHVDVWVWIYQ